MAQKDSVDYYYNLGKKAFTEKRYLLAEKMYTKSLVFEPTKFETQFELAEALYEMKKYGFAIKQYKSALLLQPNEPLVLERLANLSFMGRQWVDAISYAKICLEMKIGEKMNFIIAKSYYEQEEYVQSSKFLEAASKEDPNNGQIPYLMGNIWSEMNQPKKALEMYSIALSKDTSNTNWIFEVATLYNDLGDSKTAISYYEKALAKGMSSDLNLKTTLGLAYINAGQYEKGEDLVKMVVAKKPMDKTIFNNVAYAYYDVKKFDKAIEWWDEILRIDKQDAKALYMIGIAFRKSGNEEKGNKLCDAAIALDPSLAGLKKEMMPPQGMGL